MLDRFSGPRGPALVVEALQKQQLVAGELAVAQRLAAAGKLEYPAEGDVIIQQGATDEDVFFIIAGEAWVQVNQLKLYPRPAGVTVGEIAAANPSLPRTATIVAGKDTAILRVTAADFEAAADGQPLIWKRLAGDLASRLQQRNALVRKANDKPRIFLISSLEAKEVAECLQAKLIKEGMMTRLWTDEVFGASSYPLDSLKDVLDESDFAIAIAQGDDLVHTRGVTRPAPRDNVLVELGMFIGRLGRERSFLVVPKEDEAVSLPSDFKGLTPITYVPTCRDDLPLCLAPALEEIKRQVRLRGLRAV